MARIEWAFSEIKQRDYSVPGVGDEAASRDDSAEELYQSGGD